jgi:hypothetical protein
MNLSEATQEILKDLYHRTDFKGEYGLQYDGRAVRKLLNNGLAERVEDSEGNPLFRITLVGELFAEDSNIV